MTNDGAVAYETNAAHIRDELDRLDLILRRVFLGTRQESSTRDQFAGLVIQPEQIDSLLVPPGTAPRKNEPGSLGQSLSLQVEELDRAIAAANARIEPRLAEAIANDGDCCCPRLLWLAKTFGLSEFEQRCLLVCLAPEINLKYQTIYAYLNDDVTRKCPTISLVLSLFCEGLEENSLGLSAFRPQGTLRRMRLLRALDCAGDESRPLLTRSLMLDERVAGYLLDDRSIDPLLGDSVQFVDPSNCCSLFSERKIADQTSRFVTDRFHPDGEAAPRVVMHVSGPEGAGDVDVAVTAATQLGLPLLVADIRRLQSSAEPTGEQLWRLAREACLQSAVLFCQHFDVLLNEACDCERKEFLNALEGFCPMTVLSSRQPWHPGDSLQRATFASIELPVPEEESRIDLWRTILGEESETRIDLPELASMFRFTPGQMWAAAESAKHLAAWENGGQAGFTKDQLYRACRAHSSQKLATVARKIQPKYRWDDIVLPEDQHVQLREIANQAKHRSLVMGKWGFGRKLSLGKGLCVLFSGPPGTGKTMAAEVLANDLGLDLYKIDLSQVVSKYIGETEKNLSRIFGEAQTSNAILFFDEADALFGKRSEVRDSHDRYANLEIAYLLQQMEEYEGVSMLATNLRKNLDEAFVRRLQFIVEFPFPDQPHREQIWRRTFPRETPCKPDIDYRLLSERFSLAGGNIKSIVLNASYLAANNGRKVGMKHLLTATRAECKKLGRVINDEEFAWNGTN